MTADGVDLLFLPLLFVFPFTIVDAGMGLLFMVLALHKTEIGIFFRSLTFTFGALILSAGLYGCVATSIALVRWVL